VKFLLCMVTISGALVGCGGRLIDEAVAQDASPIDTGTPAFDVPPSEPPPPPPGLDMLAINPTHSSLFIDRSIAAPKPATQAYRATLYRADGTSSDVTSTTTFTLDDPSLGSFVGGDFRSVAVLPGAKHGATTTVRANYGALLGSSELTLAQLDRSMDLFFYAGCCAPFTPLRAVLAATAGKAPLDLSVKLAMEPGASRPLSDFVKSVRAMAEGDSASGCAPRPTKDVDGDGIDDTFPAVDPGAKVCFEVNVPPTRTVLPDGTTRFFAANADLVGNPGDSSIERHMLLFLVPPATCCGDK
jgi:hypothetical protein